MVTYMDEKNEKVPGFYQLKTFIFFKKILKGYLWKKFVTK